MSFKKRFLAFALCVSMALFISACAKQDDVKETTQTTSAEVTQPATDTPSAEATSTDAQIKVDPATTALPEFPAVDASYFDDAAFVGDSVSLKLSYYAMSTGKLGAAQFFTSGSLGSGNALGEITDESVHPAYQGTKMLIEDCIMNSGAGKVYIMLGMNDLAVYGIDGTIENYLELISRIKEKSPEVHIIIQAMTPMTDTSNILGSSLNNEVIREYNLRLAEVAQEQGYSFLDVASVMYDEQNVSLNRDYCSDPDNMGVHFTEAGCVAWIDYLYTHTP